MSRTLEGIMDVLTDPNGVEAELERKLNYCLDRLTADTPEGLDDEDLRERGKDLKLMGDVADDLVARHMKGLTAS